MRFFGLLRHFGGDERVSFGTKNQDDCIRSLTRDQGRAAASERALHDTSTFARATAVNRFLAFLAVRVLRQAAGFGVNFGSCFFGGG